MKPITILMTVSGYDKDKRELWQIPKVQDFAWRLFAEIPWFPMMLDEADNNCSCWLTILYAKLQHIVCVNPKHPFSKRLIIDTRVWDAIASRVDKSVPKELVKNITCLALHSKKG